MILPDYFDQRESLKHLFWNTIFFRKRFYKIDYKKNWHKYDMDMHGIVDFIAGLTDCYVFCDEGQDLFDSYEGTSMSKKKRKSLTRTRHLNKTLVIVSQRAQAIAVTARANVNVFHKTTKISIPFLPPFFKIYATEEIDNQNFPIWDNATIVSSHFASKKVFNTYNSWYLRAGIPRSQDVYFEAYDLATNDKLSIAWELISKKFHSFTNKILATFGNTRARGEIIAKKELSKITIFTSQDNESTVPF